MSPTRHQVEAYRHRAQSMLGLPCIRGTFVRTGKIQNGAETVKQHYSDFELDLCLLGRITIQSFVHSFRPSRYAPNSHEYTVERELAWRDADAL